MAARGTHIKVHPYAWDPDRPTRREGARVIIGKSFLFIPWDQIPEVADKIIDLYEQHTTEQNGSITHE